MGRWMGHDYDATIKEMVWTGTPALLRMLTGLRVERFVPTEFARVRLRRPDMVAELEGGTVFHLELESGVSAAMRWRMYEYYGLVSECYGDAPVTQLVLRLGERRSGEPGGIFHPNLSFRYEVRHIADFDAGPLLDSPSPDDAVLAILCECDDIRKRVRAILERLAMLDRRDRNDAANRLLTLSKLRKAAPVVVEEVKNMAVRFTLEEYPLYDEAFAKGEMKGKVEGEVKGKISALLRLMERRAGPVPVPVMERVRDASVEDIDRWFDIIADARSLSVGDLDVILAGRPN
ncbi:hypothetical protein N825_31655 [Skermanella stibiiresistens SB22]|uniref:DUF4351 domain-containing protein n=2 Tax=Skermanella TaxID=204447 RepID=W9H4V6_9PROT|nr:hypothetical protein N825_31655 [Skermanella stibiiresistens SB22]